MRPGSLRRRVVLLVLAAIAAVLLPLVGATYLFTMSEVDELFDARLAENAKTLDALGAQAASAADAGAAVQLVPSAHARGDAKADARGHVYESQIGFQVFGGDGVLRLASDNFRTLELGAATRGYADVRIESRRWRVFTWRTQDGRTIRTGERYDSRREIARALAAEACLPLLLAFPLLALLVGLGVHRGLGPLRELAAQLARRPVDDTRPVASGDAPRELQPVTESLNALLQRLARVLADERAFTTNAAHELRTPLAGALIHLENAAAASTPAQSQAAITQAHEGLARLARLVGQLLDLARWDAGATQPMTAVDLRLCIDDELADAGSTLADRNLEVRWQAPRTPCSVEGWAPGLRSLVRNLLENAIRHSPPEGHIDLQLAVLPDAIVFSIDDQGPGIAEHARTQMLRRFSRGPLAGPGAGIGLALVSRIADVHHATVTLRDGRTGWGLGVDVRFPRAAVAATAPAAATGSSISTGVSP